MMKRGGKLFILTDKRSRENQVGGRIYTEESGNSEGCGEGGKLKILTYKLVEKRPRVNQPEVFASWETMQTDM